MKVSISARTLKTLVRRAASIEGADQRIIRYVNNELHVYRRISGVTRLTMPTDINYFDQTPEFAVYLSDVKQALSLFGHDDLIDIEITDHKITLTCDSARRRIETVNACDFDVMNVDLTVPSFQLEMETSKAKNTINSLLLVMPANDVRYYLNGAFFTTMHDAGLDIVAADGHRLSIDHFHDVKDDKGNSFIVPYEAIATLKKCFTANNSNHVIIRYCADVDGSDTAHFHFSDGTTISSFCIDAHYPNYKKVVPCNHDSVRVNRKVLLNLLKYSWEATKKKDKHPFLNIAVNRCIELSHESDDLSFRNSLDYISRSGNTNLTCKFNALYLHDAVNSTMSKEIELIFNSTSPANTSLLIKDPSIDRTLVVMPMLM